MNKLIEALKFYAGGLHYTEFFDCSEGQPPQKITIINDRGETAEKALASINITPTEARAALEWLDNPGRNIIPEDLTAATWLEKTTRANETIRRALSAFAGVE